jgi:Flp pilus assembly pilin Flp
MLRNLSAIIRGSKDEIGAKVLEVSALATFAAVMMIAGFKVILASLAS